MNMSYCRFRNTLADLRDCADALEDKPCSPEEEHAREELIALCAYIASRHSQEERADHA